MGRRNRKGRDVHGIVVVDKPSGASSNHILQQVRRLFDAKKAGHTGSLDPLASGVLPVCLGEATKLSSFLLEADKSYDVTCQLGATTDSGDADGQILEYIDVPEFDQATLQQVVETFVGEQDQVPPMFSALKHQGQPLYKLARQGIEVERKSRRIQIYNISILDVGKDYFTLSVRCSKGTYIRTLVEDISHALGTAGYVTMLRRTSVAGYTLQDAVTPEALENLANNAAPSIDNQLRPPEEALEDWPSVHLNTSQSDDMRYGRSVIVAEQSDTCANVRLFNDSDAFIGIGEMTAEGVVKPKRLFAHFVSA
jgi:tRNA pseudouridine55 synthase